MEQTATYYTRPMSEAWSQLRDIDGLADNQADIEFAIPLAELPRLRAQLADAEGTVRGRARFRREAGFVCADLEISGVVGLVCQRCLGPMRFGIDAAARVALVATEAESDRAPEALEPMLAPGGRIMIRDLVEEELLLALPLVPLHERADECAGATQAVEQTPEAPATHKPFERLAELLKRDE